MSDKVKGMIDAASDSCRVRSSILEIIKRYKGTGLGLQVAIEVLEDDIRKNGNNERRLFWLGELKKEWQKIYG